MKRVIILYFFVCAAVLANAQKQDINALYNALDRHIDSSQVFIDRHEELIKSERTKLASARNDEERYYNSYQLYLLYKAYQNDSALTYLHRCSVLAKGMNRRDLDGECLSLMAFQCSTVGYYDESLSLLKGVNSRVMNRNQKTVYYKAYNHVYGELAYFCVIPDMKRMYQMKADRYRDSVFMTTNVNSFEYLLQKQKIYYERNDFKKAMGVNDKWLTFVKRGTHDFAIVAFYRYLLYNRQGMVEQAKVWLAESALCDIENAVMDQASLLELANIISNENKNMERAYNYIGYSWKVAGMFGTKVRSSQISPILRVIDNKYQQQIRDANKKLSVYIIVVSVLAVMLLLLLYYANKQRHKISKVKDKIILVNRKLEKVNKKLYNANKELDDRNGELAKTVLALSNSNKALNESNKVKEEYIGRFLGLCSIYVDRLGDIRKKVNKMVKNRRFDELFEMTRSSELNEKEINELYSNFDDAFLHLFPNFDKDFNALLKPSEQIHLTEDRHMQISMRIFALIRLGIDDSSKIATFLHYSVNTIYNYRARVKNAAIVNRDDFERMVKEIGMKGE